MIGAPAAGASSYQPGAQADLDGAGGRMLDAANQANPLYAVSVDVIKGIDAGEKGDYEGVGRAGMGVVATVVVTAITLKAGARGSPPKQLELPFVPRQPLTRGILMTENGVTPLRSGIEGPARGIPKGGAGFNIVTRTHVEGHAAAAMRSQGVKSGTLYINNPEICVACTKLLPRMLPPGSQLKVVLPDGSAVRFKGSSP
jgi:hypothetical protein